MKGVIFDIKHFAVHDGEGIRTTLFMKGCPLSCVWCHNPEGLSFNVELAFFSHKCCSCGECVKACKEKAHVIDGAGVHTFDRKKCVKCGKCVSACGGDALKLFGKEVEVNDVLPELLSDKDFFDTSGGGVTLSGGECLMQADFCAELLKRLKENGVNTAVDTSGYADRSALDKIIPYTDAFLYDLKAFDEKTHIACTGKPNKIILDNLRYLLTLGKKVEIRIPFVPEKNGDELLKIAKFLSTFDNPPPVRILPYHNLYGSKSTAIGVENVFITEVPKREQTENVKQIFLSYGITVKE